MKNDMEDFLLLYINTYNCVIVIKMLTDFVYYIEVNVVL